MVYIKNLDWKEYEELVRNLMIPVLSYPEIFYAGYIKTEPETHVTIDNLDGILSHISRSPTRKENAFHVSLQPGYRSPNSFWTSIFDMRVPTWYILVSCPTCGMSAGWAIDEPRTPLNKNKQGLFLNERCNKDHTLMVEYCVTGADMANAYINFIRNHEQYKPVEFKTIFDRERVDDEGNFKYKTIDHYTSIGIPYVMNLFKDWNDIEHYQNI